MEADVRIYLIHDHACTIAFDLPVGEEAYGKVMQLQRQVRQKQQEGSMDALLDMVPAYNSLTLYFSERVALAEKINELKALTDLPPDHANDTNTTTCIVIPVCYELPFAIDMPALSATLCCSAEEIVTRHSQKKYQVFMNGFTPGFAYMGMLDPTLQVPRKKLPTTHVPAGSVAIAANQTGIYPFDGPGGWHIIGRTPLKMFDKTRVPACLLMPGHAVTFKPITLHEFEHWS